MNFGPDLYFCSVAMDFLHGSADPTFLQIDIPGTRQVPDPVGQSPGTEKWHSGDGRCGLKKS